MRLADAVTERQLRNIGELYSTAFPAEEQKPFSLLLEKRDEGFVELLSIEDEKETFVGLAIVIVYDDLCLLDYFAVLPQRRGMGAGSSALKLLLNRYADKRLLLEIESTKKEASNSEQRLRRKAFYTANGMAALDYCVDLFGVEMEILTYRCDVSFEEYHSIFENVFSPRAAKNVKLIK